MKRVDKPTKVDSLGDNIDKSTSTSSIPARKQPMGKHWLTSKMPFEWRLIGGPI